MDLFSLTKLLMSCHSLEYHFSRQRRRNQKIISKKHRNQTSGYAGGCYCTVSWVPQCYCLSSAKAPLRATPEPLSSATVATSSQQLCGSGFPLRSHAVVLVMLVSGSYTRKTLVFLLWQFSWEANTTGGCPSLPSFTSCFLVFVYMKGKHSAK